MGLLMGLDIGVVRGRWIDMVWVGGGWRLSQYCCPAG